MSANQSNVETVRQTMGKHPDDIVGIVREATNVCGWMRELFRSIEEASEAENAGMAMIRVRALAGIGAYLAADLGNWFDCERGEMVDSLKKAGE